MKHLFAQIMIALALMCGAVFIAGMFVGCFSDNINVIRTGLTMSLSSVIPGFVFALIGADLSD